MEEKKNKHPRIADVTTMTEEQVKELLSLEDDNPDVEEYSRRVEDFYKKHNLRSATLEERWAMDSEEY